MIIVLLCWILAGTGLIMLGRLFNKNWLVASGAVVLMMVALLKFG